MKKNILLIVISIMFGYTMAPQIVSAAKIYTKHYTIPAGVNRLQIISKYKGDEVLNHTLSVKPGQRFIIKSK